jgi:hypothetical protein
MGSLSAFEIPFEGQKELPLRFGHVVDEPSESFGLFDPGGYLRSQGARNVEGAGLAALLPGKQGHLVDGALLDTV